MAYRGIFKARNPGKYKGDYNNIVYRSRWELKLMMHLDEHPDVLVWSSEEVVVPYTSPIDGKRHRYFVDFFVKKKNRTGVVESVLIEVKPLAQTRPPEVKISKGQKPTRRYINEVMTWGVNEAKWKAATEYCKDKGWKFIIMTEKELGITF
tara:strand:- start:628 stop:1080 length:453 start_codon:yes stop_codon:yes gene_type:complete